jgi:NAD(P)-dependent dehydrogenase (short-subunit alcohol dehydrogenase family)
MSERFDGRRVLVTGGSQGIGLAISSELASRGARVVIAARNAGAIEAALTGLPGEGHESVQLDVCDEAAWRHAFERIDRSGPMHGLVAAAGELGPIGELDQVPPQEFAHAIAVNLIGTALALSYSLPRLKATEGRAVTFSGGGATSPLPRYDAYAASKAAVVRLTENLASSGSGVEINSVAPGFVATRMHDGTIAAGAAAAGAGYYERTRKQLAEGGFPAHEAAELVCFLLSDQARGISGRLISAQWDPWRDPLFRARLRERPDLGTLRRIDDQFFSAIESEAATR